jgi:hypothetical protein
VTVLIEQKGGAFAGEVEIHRVESGSSGVQTTTQSPAPTDLSLPGPSVTVITSLPVTEAYAGMWSVAAPLRRALEGQVLRAIPRGKPAAVPGNPIARDMRGRIVPTGLANRGVIQILCY